MGGSIEISVRKTGHNEEETALIRRAKAGEAYAFDRLFTLHKDAVYACLWHLLDGDADLVEEAVGNVFISAFRGLRGFRGHSSLGTWLYRIAVNEALARRNQKKRWILFGGQIEAESTVSNPETEVIEDDERQRIWRAVRALPEPYKTPVVLHYMSNLSSQEIGLALRRPAGTVRYQLSRAMQILRERMGSEWTK